MTFFIIQVLNLSPYPFHFTKDSIFSHVLSSLIHVAPCKPCLVLTVPVVIPDGRRFRQSVRQSDPLHCTRLESYEAFTTRQITPLTIVSFLEQSARHRYAYVITHSKLLLRFSCN